MDSGVATSARSMPNVPARRPVTCPGSHLGRPSPGPGRRSRRTRPARPGSGTASRARSRSSRPGAPPRPAPPAPSVGVHPAGLQAQQGGHRLEVVLHPVVDLPDGGVLGDQLALAAAQLGDVPEQHQRADAGALGLQRDGPQLDDPAAALHLGLARRPAARQLDQRLVHRPAYGGEFGGGPAQVVADQVGGEAEPVVGGQGVGAGVLDDARPRRAGSARRPTRGRGVHVDLLAGNGKRAGGDHLREVGGALQVGELQPAGGAHGEQVGVARRSLRAPALPAYRDGLDPDRDLLAPLGVALADDPALVERGVQQRAAAAGTRWPTMSSW